MSVHACVRSGQGQGGGSGGRAGAVLWSLCSQSQHTASVASPYPASSDRWVGGGHNIGVNTRLSTAKKSHTTKATTAQPTRGVQGRRVLPPIISPGENFATLEIPKGLRRHNPCSCGEVWNCSAKIPPGENFATFLNGENFPAKFSHGDIPPSPPPCTTHANSQRRCTSNTSGPSTHSNTL